MDPGTPPIPYVPAGNGKSGHPFWGAKGSPLLTRDAGTRTPGPLLIHSQQFLKTVTVNRGFRNFRRKRRSGTCPGTTGVVNILRSAPRSTRAVPDGPVSTCLKVGGAPLAAPSTGGPDVQVVSGHRVPLRTVREVTLGVAGTPGLRSPRPLASRDGTPDVHGVRDRLQVLGVHAVLDLAEVIQDQTRRDRSPDRLVGPPVGQDRPAVTELAVPVRRGSGPQPAPGGLVHLAPEPVHAHSIALRRTR